MVTKRRHYLSSLFDSFMLREEEEEDQDEEEAHYGAEATYNDNNNQTFSVVVVVVVVVFVVARYIHIFEKKNCYWESKCDGWTAVSVIRTAPDVAPVRSGGKLKWIEHATNWIHFFFK